MRFHYCPDCGASLDTRVLGDEGEVPWCSICQKPLFDMFSACVIALVVNNNGDAAILRQGYISGKYGNLVSGYMKPGEAAEECVRREITEELGITVTGLEIVGTWWMEKKGLLMIGFFARTDDTEFHLSDEVDSVRWVPVEDALYEVHPEGSVSYALVRKYLDRLENIMFTENLI